MKTLFPIQRELVDSLREILLTHGSGLNSSATGTGKTLMSVELARDLGLAPLVVCPKAVMSGWQRTFEEQGVPYLGIINYEKLRTGNSFYGTWDGPKPKKNARDRRPFVYSDEVQLIIWDEVHRCLPGNTRVMMEGGSLKEIQHISVGDRVETPEGPRPVISKVHSGIKECLTFTTEKGVITLSDEHRIYTEQGWQEAGQAETGSYTYVHRLWGRVSQEISDTMRGLSQEKQGESIRDSTMCGVPQRHNSDIHQIYRRPRKNYLRTFLSKCVFLGGSGKKRNRSKKYAETSKEEARRFPKKVAGNEDFESYGRPRSKKTSRQKCHSNLRGARRISTKFNRGKWHRANQASARVVGATTGGVASRVSGSGISLAHRVRVANHVGGYGPPRKEVGYRVRRVVSQHDRGKRARCQKRGASSGSWVETTSHEKPRGFLGYRSKILRITRVDPQSCWDIGVEGAECFYAEGHLVHNCKSPKSQNSKMLRYAKGTKARPMYNVLLSATAASDPTEMKASGYLLGLHEYVNFMHWAKQLGCNLDPWNNLKFTESKKKATVYLAELRESIYPEKGVKISRAQMAEFFSNTQLIDDPLDFGDDGAIAKLYDEMETYIEELDAKEMMDNPDPAAEALIAMLRARQRVELLKVSLIVEMIQEAVAEGFHVAVFLNFNDTIRALNEKLGGSVPIVWGTDPETKRQQTDEERNRAIDSFQSNVDNIILLNIEAGGVAINLHDELGGAPRLALISPTWNEKSLQQVLGRVDRAGAKTDTLQRILFAAGTIEETVREALARKLENLKSLHEDMPKKPASAPSPPAKKPRSKKKEAPVVEDVIDVEAIIIDEDGEPAHATFGPSSLKHFEICPSYTNRQEKEGDVNEAAESGTRIHNALEVEDPELLDDEEEQSLAWMMLEQVRQIELEHGVAIINEDGELEEGDKWNEIRLYINLAHHKTFGTLDRLMIRGRVAVAQDYKCGVTPVDDAEINAQAWSYALGIFEMFPEVEIIHFYFLIPRQEIITHATFVRHEEVEPEDYWEENEIKPVATMAEIHLRIDLIIERARELVGKVFNPQAHNCEWCGNKIHCEALAHRALVIANQYEVEGLQLPENLYPEDMDSGVDIGKARMLVQVLEVWIEAVKDRANELYKDHGVEIPGFVWKTRKTSRTISDPIAAFNVLEQEVGIDVADFLGCAGSIKITELEKLIKTKAPKGRNKEDFLEEVTGVLTDHEILSGGVGQYGYLAIDRSKK